MKSKLAIFVARRKAGPKGRARRISKGVIYREDMHISQNLNKDRRVGKPIKEKVEEAAQIAREIAPFKTGAYRDSIKTDQVISGDRWVTRLMATDFKSGWIEFGTSRMPAFATLRVAMEAAGLHVIQPKNSSRAPASFMRRGKTQKQFRSPRTGRFTK